MANLTRQIRLSAALIVVMAVASCGPQFDPASKLQSLRILAVKKDHPYLRVKAPNPATNEPSSGEPSNVAGMTVALEDARAARDRKGPLQKMWFAGCSNPPGDNYFTCMLSVWLSFKAYDALAAKPLTDGETWDISQASQADIFQFVKDTFPKQFAQSGSTGSSSGTGTGALSQEDIINQALALRVGAGDTFQYQIPDWLIAKHTPSADPNVPPYGMSQVYFAACDGTIGLSAEWQGEIDPLTVLTDATKGFPLDCYDTETETQRGPDNFMVSYSNLYAYEKLTNQNPVISGIKLDGKEVDTRALCIGKTCPLYEDSCRNENAPRVPRCTKAKDADCPSLAFYPVLNEQDNSEVDTTATAADPQAGKLLEQMWIRYYANLGKMKADAKRLQDANEGWFAEHGTEWQVPRKSGSAHVWTVAYDNRGGVDWVRTSICVSD